MASAHPFAAVEELLFSPAADGVFLVHVEPRSPLGTAGVRPGSIVVGIDGGPAPDRNAFFAALRPVEVRKGTVCLRVRDAAGAVRDVEVPVPLRGCTFCGVRQGVAAWDAAPDTAEAFDASGLEDGMETWLRNGLGGERAGYEGLKVRRRGDTLEVEVLFRLGGADGRGGTWDYATRSLSTHRLARGLPLLRTAFWEMGALRGDVHLEGDRWRGTRGRPDGTTEPVDAAAVMPVMSAYPSTLLPLTMPLRAGARLTYGSCGDGTAVATGRDRFECVGRATVPVEGRSVEAWCFVQRHYGLDTYGGDERFYVTDDRRLVRVEWGPNSAHCVGERVPKERVLDGVPPHVTLPPGA